MQLARCPRLHIGPDRHRPLTCSPPFVFPFPYPRPSAADPSRPVYLAAAAPSSAADVLPGACAVAVAPEPLAVVKRSRFPVVAAAFEAACGGRGGTLADSGRDGCGAAACARGGSAASRGAGRGAFALSGRCGGVCAAVGGRGTFAASGRGGCVDAAGPRGGSAASRGVGRGAFAVSGRCAG